jgi:hypothetical protein
VLEVRHTRPEPPEQPRQAESHPQHLAAGFERDWLHALGHEVRASRHRFESQTVVEFRQLSQQCGDVAFVTGAPPAEDVGVDDDERLAHAATSR